MLSDLSYTRVLEKAFVAGYKFISTRKFDSGQKARGEIGRQPMSPSYLSRGAHRGTFCPRIGRYFLSDKYHGFFKVTPATMCQTLQGIILPFADSPP